MKIQTHRRWLICIVSISQVALAQVPVSINSGNPAFPFPQFLNYGTSSESLMNFKVRLFHDANEAYINYGNYRF